MQLELKQDIRSSGFEAKNELNNSQANPKFADAFTDSQLLEDAQQERSSLIYLYRSEPRKRYLLIKSVIDTTLSIIMLILAAPLMLLTYIAIKIASPGPALLRQKRLTLNGKEFTLFKFRTMRLDAEKISGAKMADENDPRIFPLGRFLRKARLDELPQLINVIRGEMSLVGPRPERPEIASTLEKDLRGFYRRTRTKAGLTGLAQVQHGYCSSIDSYRRKLALDLLYVRRQSLWLDTAILFRTVTVILSFRGAR